MKAVINLAVRLHLACAERRVRQHFLRQTRDPARAQRELLLAILRRNRATRFGREHGFDTIRSPEDFATRVPIHGYEDLRPRIERQERDGTPELTVERPIMYARTSGSTGDPKLIPILESTIAQHRRSQQIYSCCHASEVPGIFDGGILGLVSPAVEGRLPTGTPYGSASGLIYQNMPPLLRRKYVVPPEVFACADHDLKYLLIAIFAVADRSLTYAAGANPSSFLRIAKVIRTATPAIIAALECGELPGGDQLAPAIHRKLHAAFRRNPGRAEELRRLSASGEEITFAMLWPELKALSCWREGSCRALLPALQRLLPASVPVLEMGYLSSECRGSVPVASLQRREVPTIHENYFEFVERAAWESGRRDVQTITQLEPGRSYYVIVTTQEGLYRYFMNDLVVVDGFFERTPTIKFLEKGAGVTSITGEKLYESQVSSAVESVAQARGWSPEFFVLVADLERQGYTFYAETHPALTARFAADLDRAIASQNIEYESKRASGRLHPVEVRLLRAGAADAYQARLLAQGQREAQFKFLRLQRREHLAFDFDAHLASSR